MARATKTPKSTDQHLIFDWNQVHKRPRPQQPFELVDESVRDGVQSPSVTDPKLSDKIELL